MIAPPSFRLIVTQEGRAIAEAPLDHEVLVGRSQECRLRLDHRSISRKHLVFRAENNRVFFENQSEFSPVRLNGKEVSNAVLELADVIELGPYLIRCEKVALQTEKKNPAPAPTPALEPTVAIVQPEPPQAEPVPTVSPEPALIETQPETSLETDAPSFGVGESLELDSSQSESSLPVANVADE
jgi:pSer/pThr/pTyr-binding forkhead associated (FHA) protein